MTRTALILLLAVLPVLSIQGQTTTVVDRHESVAPKIMTWPIEVPPFSIEHQVRLSFEARIDWKGLAGSNPWIIVTVNGNPIVKPDLLNKTDDFVLRRGLDLTWYKSGRWRIVYSPDFEMAVKNVEDGNSVEAKDEPYRFVFDITRHVKPGKDNKLSINHLKLLQHPSTLVLRNVKVEVGYAIDPPSDDAVKPAPTGPLETFVAGGARKVGMRATGQDATINVRVAGQQIKVRTRVSLPGGKWREAKGKGSKTFTAGPCRVSRKIAVRGDHVHVADTFTNTSSELIGVMVEHHADMVGKPEAMYLAGRKSFTDTGIANNGAHPSVFVQFDQLGVGLVAEDDIFRVHVRSFHNPETFGLIDNRLGIPAKSSHTLEWSIYPLPGAGAKGDYWTFVNTVRRNWGVNFEIPGPFSFVHIPRGLTGEQYAKWMHDRGLKYICGGIAKYTDGKYAHGTGIMFAPEFVAQERDWTTKMAAADPDLVPLAYFHALCSTEPDGQTKYADSRLLDGKGEHIEYPYHYPLPLYVPTVENSYGKALWGYVHTLIDQVGVRGIYWDEMAYSVERFAPGIQWDNCTVTIDPRTHRVTGKLTSVPLIMQPLQMQIIDYVRGKGLFLMANGQSHTRTVMRTKLVRFVETNTYSALADVHLACPLGLGNHHSEKTHEGRAEHVRELLKRGAVYYGHYYDDDPAPWNFNDKMFPITPQQIGPGYVIGKERIHATISGRFGFRDGAAAEVYVVDAQGGRVTSGMHKEVREAGKRLYELRLPSDHFAILVKR